MMTPRAWSLVNAVVVAAVVGWNFWTARYGLAGRTVGGMSDVYDTLFTPAGYAFSIWGLIFLGLVANAAYQLWLAFAAGPAVDAALEAHRRAFFARLGPLLVLANVANCLWTVLWLTEQTAASVVVLASMFALLSLALHRLDVGRWDAPLEVVGLVGWPLGIYAGWVTVAVLANLSAFLAKHGVVPGDSEAWAIAMIAVATAYNVALVALRNLRMHALVAIWAAIAIAVRQWGNVASVQWTAVAAVAILGAAATAHALRHRRA